MKKFLLITIVFLFGFCAFAQSALVYEENYIQCQEGYFWEFTVPYNSDYIDIICATSAKYSYKMIFAVVPSEAEAMKFCINGGDSTYVPGTYKKNTQEYQATLTNLKPGKTYYFCAYNDTKGHTSAKQYKVRTAITSY